MVALMAFLGSLVGSLLGTLAARWLIAGRVVFPQRAADSMGEPRPRPAPNTPRKPVYNTPEKAALAEEGRRRNLPPQWNRTPPAESTFTRIPTDR